MLPRFSVAPPPSPFSVDSRNCVRTACPNPNNTPARIRTAMMTSLMVNVSNTSHHHLCPKAGKFAVCAYSLHLLRPIRTLLQVVEHLTGLWNVENAFIFAVGV